MVSKTFLRLAKLQVNLLNFQRTALKVKIWQDKQFVNNNLREKNIRSLVTKLMASNITIRFYFFRFSEFLNRKSSNARRIQI